MQVLAFFLHCCRSLSSRAFPALMEPERIMVLAWMLWSPYALETRTELWFGHGSRTELWFGHGCSGHRMLLEPERNHGFGMDALVTVCSGNTNGAMIWAWMLWFGHGCSGHRMLLEPERNYGLGMDALFTVCSWNLNGIMFLAWML